MAAEATSQAQVVINAVDRVTRPVRRINDRIQSIQEPVRRVNRSISQFGDVSGVNRLINRVTVLGSRIRGVGRGFTETADRLGRIGATVGATAGGAAAALGTLSFQSAQTGEQALRTAERLGIDIETLQELTAAADRFNVRREAMTDGLKELQLRADEFATTGKGESAEAFQRLGLDRERLRQVKDDTAALFSLVQGRIRQVQDTAARQRIVDEVFGGEGGEQLVEFLGVSQERIRELRQEARNLGVVFSRDEAERAAAFMRTTRSLTDAFGGLGRAITLQVLPSIQPMVQRVTELISANRSLIAQRIGDWVARVRDGFQALMDPTSELRQRIDEIVGSVQTAVDWFTRISQVVGGPVQAALITVGAWTFAPLIVSVVSLGSAVVGVSRALIGVGVRVLPLVGGAVGALIPRLATLRGAMFGAQLHAILMAGGFRRAIGAVARFTRIAAIGGLLSSIASGARAVGAAVAGLAARAIPAAIAGIRAMSAALLTTPVGWIITGVTAIAGAAWLIYDNWGPIADFFERAWDNVTDRFDRAVDSITGFAREIPDRIGQGIRDAGQWLASLPQKAWDAITRAVDFVERKVAEIDLVDSGRRIAHSLIDGIKEKIPEFEWPGLPKFTWPELPEFTWPSLPAFDWPQLPEFNWPTLPDFGWPSLPDFSWPSLPSFSWPRLPGFAWPSLPSFSWPELPGFAWPSLPTFSWPSVPDFGWPRLPTFSWPQLPEFAWPSLPTFSWPSLPDFGWPRLPEFSWPSLPDFAWPSLPSFSWPDLPSFSWPSLPTFTWPELPDFTWPRLPGFAWPSLPSFSWPTLPRFEWPELPSFASTQERWQDFKAWVDSVVAAFAWPSLPDLSVPAISWSDVQHAWSQFTDWMQSTVPSFSWPSLPTLSVPSFSFEGLRQTWKDFTDWVNSVIPSFEWPELPDLGLPNLNLIERTRETADFLGNKASQAGQAAKDAADFAARKTLSAASSAASFLGFGEDGLKKRVDALVGKVEGLIEEVTKLIDRIGQWMQQLSRPASTVGQQAASASRAAQSAIQVQPPRVRVPDVQTSAPNVSLDASKVRGATAGPGPARGGRRPGPSGESGDQVATAAPTRTIDRSHGGVNVTFSPTINLQGDASQVDAERIKRALQENMRWLVRQIDDAQNRRGRGDLHD